MQVVCESSSQPVVVQQIDSGSAEFSIRQQEFTALAPAYLGNIKVSVQQASCCDSSYLALFEHRKAENADGSSPKAAPPMHCEDPT